MQPHHDHSSYCHIKHDYLTYSIAMSTWQHTNLDQTWEIYTTYKRQRYVNRITALSFKWTVTFKNFKPGTRGPVAHARFLEIISTVNIGVCVFLPPRPLITSHVKGMRNNWIRQFYGHSVYLYNLLLINWMGMALVTLPIVNACRRRQKTGTSYSRTTRQRQQVGALQL